MKRILTGIALLLAQMAWGGLTDQDVDAYFQKKEGGQYPYVKISETIISVQHEWIENPVRMDGVMSNLYFRILQMSIPTNAFTSEMAMGFMWKKNLLGMMVRTGFFSKNDFAIHAWTDYLNRLVCIPTDTRKEEFEAALRADEIEGYETRSMRMGPHRLAHHRKWTSIRKWNNGAARLRRELLRSAAHAMKWRIGFLRGDAVKAEDLDLIFSVAMRANLNDEEMKILFDQNEKELTVVIADLSPEEKERLLKILEGKSTEPEARALAYYQRLLALPILPEQDQADRLLVCKRQAIQKFLSRECCQTNDVAIDAWADFVGRLVPVSTNLMVEKCWPVEALKDGEKGRRQTVRDLQAGARRWRAIKHWNSCIARHRHRAVADAKPWIRRRLGSLEKSNPSADEAFMQRLKSRARLTEKECEQLFARPHQTLSRRVR